MYLKRFVLVVSIVNVECEIILISAVRNVCQLVG